ncbi:hypothetical protein BH006_06995 [Salmonella enterica]|uniref:Uncharacterized protein n=1 Tax=Salmonella enterica TaxID=28901 RepID=A0A3F3IEN3_SALER|nr:hypothetical protein [Salmonella enterica]OEH95172.1 hypothetical protein BH006_06995 [Salmonella enterica]
MIIPIYTYKSETMMRYVCLKKMRNYTMIIGNEDHMTTAARILSQETIRQLQNDKALMTQGRKILARWAINQPNDLKALENQGYLMLYSTLINQQETEMDALTENPGQSMSEQEMLELRGVNTSLLISD